MLDKSLLEAMNFSTKLVEKKMEMLLPKDFHESRLAEAIEYSVMSGGKRIRPFLTIISAQIFGVDPLNSVNAAAAIEFIHTYSLIHDDLPAMDNDDFRRGKLTCHKKFNDATAILAGDALLTYAFEILSDPATHKDPFVRCELVKMIASAAGFKGMVGGQMIDLEMAEKKISKEQLAKLHRLKTGELFMASCAAGAILGHAKESEKNALRYYAHDLGLAFQIKDDILDHYGVESGKVNLDETVHKKPKDNASIVDIVGIDHALKQLNMLKEQAISHLKIFGNKSSLLIELSEFIVSRER
ncbi:MAG: polyprenyl synthetase family protein [Rickettsiales bacterium]|nr:polyprenyl synthetase family protein [Rickettsiales bacterium]